MDHNAPTKEIVTVADMARMCCLSRSRFYMLVKEGIMPTPSRNAETKRPFYTREQQEQCLLVRKTNCGINGQPVLFYSQGVNRQTAITAPKKTMGRAARRTAKQPKRPVQTDLIIDELRQGLEQLGITDASNAVIRTALADAYPDGHAKVATATLLMTAFRELNRQNSPDNLAR